MPCGVATAPVLYAADEYPQLKPLIERKFRGADDVQTVRAWMLLHFLLYLLLMCLVMCPFLTQAVSYILKSNAMERSRELAIHHAQQVCLSLYCSIADAIICSCKTVFDLCCLFQAVAAVSELAPSAAQSALLSLVNQVLTRKK